MFRVGGEATQVIDTPPLNKVLRKLKVQPDEQTLGAGTKKTGATIE